jgi:hypothetical protein
VLLRVKVDAELLRKLDNIVVDVGGHAGSQSKEKTQHADR